MFRCPSEGQAFAMFDHLVIHVLAQGKTALNFK